MDKVIRVAAVAICVWIFSACSEEGIIVEDNPALDRDYDLIVGILSADQQRDYRHEIFVGRIERTTEEIPPTPLGEDILVNRALLTLRSRYLGVIKPRNDALVRITDEQGKIVEFVSVGNGFYRDAEDALILTPFSTYELTVEYNGALVTAETRIPDEFELGNTSEGDTVTTTTVDDPDSGEPIQVWEIVWGKSIGNFFYRIDISRSYSDITAISHTLQSCKLGIVYDFTQQQLIEAATTIRLEAPDTNYARLYQVEAPHTGSNEWMDWFDEQSEKQLGERSSLVGPDDVAGVFGSVYATPTVSFLAQTVIE